ncbi:MAG TPA: DUF4386 domain-containing protein, partial [Pyrinomonadaceae bacterium]|nr:DUF4386 domain-containing protein [Pyrinomonadaceae bacterium]
MTTYLSPRRLARMVGLLFLLTIVAGIFAQAFVSNRLIDFSDAVATGNNILSHQGLFQFGFTVYLVEMACQIATATLFYILLRPVCTPVALLYLVLELTGCVVKTFARVFYVAPMFVLTGAFVHGPALFRGFTVEQLQTIALILLRVNDYGAAAALAFFGLSTPLNGYLILRSNFLPRWLGVLGIVSGVGWLTFLYPPLGYRAFPIVALLGLIGAAATIFWLMVFG